MNFEDIEALLGAMERRGVRYAVFGGTALNFHGIARFTDDIDLFIEPTPENVELLKQSLREVFDDPEVEHINAAELLGEYPAVQYIPPHSSFHVDILTRLGEAFAFRDLEIVRMPFGNLTVSVVSPSTLYRMKRDTVRLKDRADAELLREKFGKGVD